MKAIHYFENGGPEVMHYGELPDPVLEDDGVLIAVEWISIEGGDLLNRLVTPPAHTPFVPGYQAAGKVLAVGPRVTRVAVGESVVGFNWCGSHADLFAVPEHFAYPIPEGMDVKQAAALPIAFGTAYDALFTYGDLREGETVLVQGGAGGVGLAAIQLAAQAGAKVIATASDAARLERLVPYGLDHGIAYRSESIAERVDALTGGEGVDIVVDMAGGKGVDALMASLRRHGRYMVVGAATGEVPQFGFFDVINKALAIKGVTFGREMHTPRAHALLAEIFARAAKGELAMPIDREFALSEGVAAHTHVANAHPFGRVMMHP